MTKMTVDRVEIFSRAIVEGKSQSDAYRAAYPSSRTWKADSVHHKASEKARSVQVMARVAELRAEIRESGMWGVVEATLALKKVVNDEESYKAADRISAVKELNAMYGYTATKKVDLTSSDGSMSPTIDPKKMSPQAMKELLEAKV